MKSKNTLFLIPARKGSKGLPKKNIKNLGGKHLIDYSVDFAKSAYKSHIDDIAITTNDIEIINLYNKDPEINIINRPDEIASDSAGMVEVILHSISYMASKQIFYEKILLLQPTSPYRLLSDYVKIEDMMNSGSEVVLSSNLTKANPYFNLYEETKDGYIKKCIVSNFKTRQECPKVFELNGMYFYFKTKKFNKYGLHHNPKTKTLIIDSSRAIDIDTIEDFKKAELYLKNFNEENNT